MPAALGGFAGTPGFPAPSPGWPAGLGALGGLGRSVNLTMPATAWLGLSDAPGDNHTPG